MQCAKLLLMDGGFYVSGLWLYAHYAVKLTSPLGCDRVHSEQDYRLNCFGCGAQNTIYTMGNTYQVFTKHSDHGDVVLGSTVTSSTDVAANEYDRQTTWIAADKVWLSSRRYIAERLSVVLFFRDMRVGVCFSLVTCASLMVPSNMCNSLCRTIVSGFSLRNPSYVFFLAITMRGI
jgi:hypothetical protein